MRWILWVAFAAMGLGILISQMERDDTFIDPVRRQNLVSAPVERLHDEYLYRARDPLWQPEKENALNSIVR